MLVVDIFSLVDSFLQLLFSEKKTLNVIVIKKKKNQQLFFMVFTLIHHRDGIKMLQ